MATITSKTIRGYTVIESIGKGGYGAVYRAFQPAVKREVAIKIILPEYANDPDFIRGFETEAELIARLEHFHIIPLYDYWREPNGAYLVTRFLKGGSLRSRLDDQGSLSAQETVRLSQQICSALAVAHKHGVIHRDIKPANILLDEEGNAYLGDFGISIAVESSDTADLSELIGTPAYLAPEQIMMEKVGPHSDIYSFGIVLYECLTGHRPYPDDASPIHLMQMTVNEPIPSLCDLLPDLPHAVEKVIFRATAKDPTKRYTNALDLALDFRKAFGDKVRSTLEIELAKSVDEGERTLPLSRSRIHATHDTHTAPTLIDSDDLRDYDSQIVPNPYKGLRAFQEADADDFFGRTALIDQLIYRMEGLQVEETLARFLALVGPSGSGKSSVVKAGLVPALRRGKLHGSENWFVVEMFPSTNPFEELEAALLKIATDALPGLLDQLKSDERGLIRAVKRILPSDDESELLLIIDQFEELFTLVEDTGLRQAFVDNILAAIHDPRSRIRIITTLRADFYDRPLQYEDLGKLIQQRTEVVLPLSTDELEAAIIEPAKRMGVTLEAGLMDAIIKDVGEQPGTLPLLQFALTDLFERRVYRQMTLSAYRDSGGVLGVLARRADELYNELDETSQAIVRQITLRLVTLGTSTEDTRRRVRRSEITIADADEAVVNHILGLFGKYRLLTFDRDPITREPTIEVAHEALIRTWTRLQEWVDASREDLKIQRRLTTAARDWNERGRDPSYLSLGVRLAEFQNFATTTDLALSLTEHAYLDASRQHEQVLQTEAEQLNTRVKRLRRAQYLGVLTALLACVALAMISLAADGTRESQQDANERLDNANTQVSLAEENLAQIKVEAESSRLEVEAQRLLENNGKRELISLLSIRALTTRYTPVLDNALGISIEEMHVRQTFSGDVNQIWKVAFSPDGQMILTSSFDGKINLWEVGSGKLLHVLDDFSNPVWSLKFSPDGQTALLGTLDGVVRIWDINTGQTSYSLQTTDHNVQTVTFSPNGEFFLLGDLDGTAQLWDIEAGEILHRFNGHTGTVLSVGISPDSQTIATSDENGITRLWDVSSGLLSHSIEGYLPPVGDAAFSQDERLILTSDPNGVIWLWNVETGALLHQLEGHTDKVWDVAFSTDNQMLITGGLDNTAHLWSLESGTLLRTLDGHMGTILNVALFQTQDNYIAVTSDINGMVRLWNGKTGQLYSSLEGHTDAVWTMTFSPDGQTILTGSWDGTARLWNVTMNTVVSKLGAHTAPISSVIFSPDGQSLITISTDDSAQFWDVETGASQHIFQEHSDEVRHVAFSPDGQTIFTGSRDGTIRLWNANSGQLIQLIEEHTNAVVSIVFSPNGEFLATASSDGIINLWDADSRTLLHKLEGHSSGVTEVAFSHSGNIIVSGGFDGTARIWDVETGAPLFILRGYTNTAVQNVKFSPDGQFILTSSWDGAARLWDVDTGELHHIFEDNTDTAQHIAFSPDGQLILAGGFDGTARLWKTDTGSLFHTLEGHTGSLSQVVLSPDGTVAITGSSDGTARLWDVDTGEVVRVLQGHIDGVTDIAFSPDGSLVATGSNDGTVRIWHTDYHDFIDYACSRMFRDFTPAERAEIGIDDTPTCPQFATE